MKTEKEIIIKLLNCIGQLSQSAVIYQTMLTPRLTNDDEKDLLTAMDLNRSAITEMNQAKQLATSIGLL